MNRNAFSLTAFVLLIAACLGCHTEPDNSFSMPSPSNGQPPVQEEDTTLADPNNPFTPTATSTDGLWKMKSGKINGTEFPASMVNATTLKLDADKYDVESAGNPDKGTCVQDLTTTPYRMTISSVEGANAGKTMLAIFEMPNERTLRICYDLEGAGFPPDFESTSENGYFSAVYSRQN